MMQAFFRPMIAVRSPSLLATYINYILSVIWAYAAMCCLGIGLLWSAALGLPRPPVAFRLVPEFWGLALTLTYLAQMLVSAFVESRYERGMLRALFWMIWYPLAFWMLNAATAVVALPRVLSQPTKERVTWVSPDRGLR